ncbi:MAG: SH3 domain-containing protein [Anaerolineales bacterium]|jgi:hypothetical protein
MFKRIYLIHILILSGILLAACAPSTARVSEPTPVAVNTLPANTASISGTLWHDLCALTGNQEPSPGCVASADGGFKANGVHDAGEPGLANMLVLLGFGVCDHVRNGLETRTNQDGAYEFANLPAGEYCIMIDPLRSENAQLLPGGWTFPAASVGTDTGAISVNLAENEGKTGIDFGWDTQSQSQPAESVADQAIPIGKVNVQALNLRAGPSLNHRIFLQLNEGTVLEIMGRSENQEWLQVRLDSGTQGWIYYEYVDTQAVIADLPLREAYGGAYLNPVDVLPTVSPPETSQPQEISVSIEANVATVKINGYIEDARLVLRLKKPDGKSSLVVGKGKTNGNGDATIQFEMPTDWPDGKPLTSGEQNLVVSSKDGKASIDVTIQYYR